MPPECFRTKGKIRLYNILEIDKDFPITLWRSLQLCEGEQNKFFNLFLPAAKITEKVDIWATGCLLIEIFGGQICRNDVF